MQAVCLSSSMQAPRVAVRLLLLVVIGACAAGNYNPAQECSNDSYLGTNRLRNVMTEGWHMACHTDLVFFCVSEIRSVVVLMILRPQSRRPFRTSTVCDGNGISPVHDFTATGEKRRHLAVSCDVRVSIEGLADQEQRSRVRMRLPTCPRSIALAEAFAESKHRHQCPVERQSPIEILHAYKDVGEHGSYVPQISTTFGPRGSAWHFRMITYTSMAEPSRACTRRQS